MRLRGCAVIDDTVDFASDRHGNAVRIGESHDDADGFDSLSDLIHRCDDFVDRLACAELLADMPVATALTGAGDDEIANAGQPSEGVAVFSAPGTGAGSDPNGSSRDCGSRWST